jgi:hypothetical protein
VPAGFSDWPGKIDAAFTWDGKARSTRLLELVLAADCLSQGYWQLVAVIRETGADLSHPNQKVAPSGS